MLVVDDERDIREALAEMLVHCGYEVKVAADGRQALELARASAPPHLILLDLMMPVMGGLEFNQAIRADPALRGIPVCLMTASSWPITPGEGIISVMRKPLDTDALVAIVDRFC